MDEEYQSFTARYNAQQQSETVEEEVQAEPEKPSQKRLVWFLALTPILLLILVVGVLVAKQDNTSTYSVEDVQQNAQAKPLPAPPVDKFSQAYLEEEGLARFRKDISTLTRFSCAGPLKEKAGAVQKCTGYVAEQQLPFRVYAVKSAKGLQRAWLVAKNLRILDKKQVENRVRSFLLPELKSKNIPISCYTELVLLKDLNTKCNVAWEHTYLVTLEILFVSKDNTFYAYQLSGADDDVFEFDEERNARVDAAIRKYQLQESR